MFRRGPQQVLAELKQGDNTALYLKLHEEHKAILEPLGLRNGRQDSSMRLRMFGFRAWQVLGWIMGGSTRQTRKPRCGVSDPFSVFDLVSS